MNFIKILINTGVDHNVADVSDAIRSFAGKHKIEENVLKAILEVESKGSAFDLQNRLIILPEEHIFYRELEAAGLSLTKPKREGLATRKWSKANYKDLQSYDARWVRLEAMAAYNLDAALRSCSWGSAQIMGFNHIHAGFDDVQSMVMALAKSKAANVVAFLTILKNFGLMPALQDKDFKQIARRYNGSGQVDYYAGRMQRAYRSLCSGNKIKSRPTSLANTLSMGASGYRVEALQNRLSELGYAVQVDGDFGTGTRGAVLTFQADSGLKADGIVGAKTQAVLDKAVPSPVTEGREHATISDLKAAGSKTLAVTSEMKSVSVIGGAVIAPVATLFSEEGQAQVEAISGHATNVTSMLMSVRGAFEPLVDLVIDYPFVVIVPLCLFGYRWAKIIEVRRLDDYKKGRHV